MKKTKVIKWALFSLGIMIMSCGITLTIWTKVLGVSPWDSFHLGLTNYLPLNIGQTCQVVGAGAILIGMLLGIKPKVGTILNMLFVGWIVNILLSLLPSGIVAEIKPLTFVIFFAGVALYGIGTGLYIAADAGIGPRDSIMVGLNRKFNIKIGRARTLLEFLVVMLAFFLSGSIGIGTIIFSLTIGFFVQMTLSTVGKIKVFQVLEKDFLK